jgi:hypothetical protein
MQLSPILETLHLYLESTHPAPGAEEGAGKGLIHGRKSRKTSNLGSKAVEKRELPSGPKSTAWDKDALILLALCGGQN